MARATNQPTFEEAVVAYCEAITAECNAVCEALFAAIDGVFHPPAPPTLRSESKATVRFGRPASEIASCR